MYMPYCVSSVADRKLITFDTLCMPRCSGVLLLFVPFNLLSLSTIKQQLTKQEGVFSEGLCTGSVECCQMTAPDFDESPDCRECLTVQTHIQSRLNVQQHCSLFLFTSVVVARSVVLLPIWQQS